MATTHPITHRQMRAAEIWVRDGCKSKARALQEAGYGKSVVRHPDRVFDSPAFLDELDKKGVNKYGIWGRMSWEGEGETIPVKTASGFDVSKIPLEQMQDLKEKLRAVDVPREEGNHLYTPIGDGVDILNCNQVQPERPENTSSFSGM